MSNPTLLEVRLHDDLVGTIERRAGRLRFTYDETWRAWVDATPLSLSMPLAAAEHSHKAVDAFLWGLLPDNGRVLNRWAREFNTSTTHPLGLLASIGDDLPGAMRIAPSKPTRRATTDRIEWLSPNDVADLLVAVKTDQTAWLGSDTAGRWSLAGAQPKIALLYDRSRGWGRPYGRVATNRILKPAVTGFDDHDLNEHLCLAAARSLGLRVVRSDVVVFGSERAIVVERYDRFADEDGTWQRVHQEDLCQALAVHPEHKYQAEGGPDPAAIVSLLRSSITDPRHVADDVNTFVDALIFNWLIGAPDAHAKNYSVLLSGRQVRLAPIYDVASALPYPDENYLSKIRLAMKIGAYYRASAIRRGAWSAFAASVGIDADTLVERIRTLATAVSDAFSDVAADTAVAELGSPLAAALTDAVARRSRACSPIV